MGLSDAIIDIVETGSNIEKKRRFRKSQKKCVTFLARLIVNTASMKLRKTGGKDTLINQMEQAKEAKKS
ncbi:MAG: hypothetical protein ACLTE2_03735 [Eubacteriales bacterium]